MGDTPYLLAGHAEVLLAKWHYDLLMAVAVFTWITSLALIGLGFFWIGTRGRE